MLSIARAALTFVVAERPIAIHVARLEDFRQVSWSHFHTGAAGVRGSERIGQSAGLFNGGGQLSEGHVT